MEKECILKSCQDNVGAGPKEGTYLVGYSSEMPDRVRYGPQFEEIREAYFNLGRAIGKRIEEGLLEKASSEIKFTGVL